MCNDEYFNVEFPKRTNDFLNLARPFTENEIQLADKDTLIYLCTNLKRKELRHYTERNNAVNILERVHQALLEGSDIRNQKDITEDIHNFFGDGL